MDNFKAILNEHWEKFPSRKDTFYQKYDASKMVDDIPKDKLFVKLKEGITTEEE